MYRDSRDRGGSSYNRSSGGGGGGGRVGGGSLSSSISLATPSFSSITMLNKGRSSGGGGGGGSSWNDSGFGSAGQQPWGSSGNDRGNMGGRGQQQQVQENVNASVYLDMDSAPTEFDAVTRVIGENGENLEYIRKTTGAQIQLQGRGTGIFNQKALHIYIEHNQTRGMERAEKLAGDLVKVVQEEYIQWQETNQQSRMGGGNYGNSNQGNNQMYGNQNRGGRGADNFNTSNTSQSFNTGSSNRGGGGGSGYQDNQRGGAVDSYTSSNQRSDNYSGSGSRFNDGGRDSGNQNMGGSRFSRDTGASSGGGNQDRSAGRSNTWADNQDNNYNRGGGGSSNDYNDRQQSNRAAPARSNDRPAPARTNTIARLDASGNWHQDEPVQDNKRSGGGGNFVDSGRSGNSNQGRDTGMNRGYERDNDRGMGRNQDRGFDRNVDRNQDRGMDRNQDRGIDRNMDRGNDRNMDRGMDRNVDRGMDRSMDRGNDRNMDRSFDRGNNDRGMDRSMDRGMDRSMDRGNDRGMDRSMDRGNDRNMDRGNDRNMDRGNDRNMDRGMNRDRGNMDRGNSRNMDRDMDRGMSRNMDPPPAPKQPKYCDICDDTFPNDDAYKTHCNGVYHAEMVLEIKARNQRARISSSAVAGGGGGGGGNAAPPPPQPSGKPQRQTNLEMWTPDREGMAEQRWVYNQVAPLFERQLEQDILKKLQEYCRSVVSNEDIMPDRSQQHMNNYCKLCKITYNDLRLHIGSNMHITYYILRQIQMGVDTFCNYYGDVPIANVDTDGGRVLAIEALNWGPALPAPSMGKPQLVERYKKLVVLSGPRNGYKCDLCRARCANMNFWVDHCTSVKHLKKMVSAMCALTREGFVREFPHTPVSPPYYAAACVAKLKDLQWHADIQVSNVQRVSQAYNTQGEWFDFRGPRGGNMGGPGGPRGGPGGPRGGPSGPRSGGPPPLMGAEAPRPRGGMEGGNQGQMRPRPGPGQPRPLMEAPVVPSMETLSPADRDLVMQVAQITGLQDRTLVMSALEALRALDPNMIGALGSLSTQAMADVDPAMIETLLGAIGGGDAVAALAGGPPNRSPSGPMRGGPPKRRMPMGRGGGPVPIKKGRF